MSPHHLAEILRDYAGFGPGIAVSLGISLVTCGYVSRALGISRAHGWTLVMSLGVVLSATITPSREALLFGAQGSGTCDLSKIGPGSWWELRHLDDACLNILLFVPLGIVIGLCPRSRAKLIVLAGAFVLPAAIELIQLVAVPLGRECQSADIVDNVFGLLLGLLAGSVAGRIWSFRPAASLTNADEMDG